MVPLGSESTTGSIGIVTLDVKLTGGPIMGNLYAAFDKTVAKNAAILEL